MKDKLITVERRQGVFIAYGKMYAILEAEESRDFFINAFGFAFLRLEGRYFIRASINQFSASASKEEREEAKAKRELLKGDMAKALEIVQKKEVQNG